MNCSNAQTDSGNINDTGSISLSGLSYYTKYWMNCTAKDANNETYKSYWFVTKNQSFVLDATLTFGGYINIIEGPVNTPPSISSPNPTNGSTGQDYSFTWNCTIKDNNNLFNWTIKCNNSQTSSGNDATNGSKTLSLSGLTISTTYKVWTNATDVEGLETKQWYTFTTKGTSVFVLDYTLTFGGYVDITGPEPVISNVYPSNGSINVVAYPQLHITVTDPNALNMDVSWSTNATGSWTETNTTVVSGSTIYQRATFANTSETKYWWTVNVNNSNGEWTNETYHFTLDNYTWGEWSGWWVVYYTDCDEPLNLASQANSTTMIYLTWTPGNNSDRTHIQYDPVSYPTAISEGNLSYNDTGVNHEQSGLQPSTTYYFTAWSYNGTNVTMSYNSSTTSSTTDADNNPPTQSGEAPVNGSTDIELTPSLYVICSDFEGSTMNATWWSNSSGSWVQFASNYSIANNTNITQTNSNFSAYSTIYYWSVNLTDSSNYTNNTYHFTTRGTYTPNPPSSFSAVANGRFQIDITWVDHAYSDSTRVEWNPTADGTWNVGEHTLLYNGTAQASSQFGLNPSTSRYYKAWSWNVTDAVWSTGSTSDATTDSNNLPILSGQSPPNSSTGISLTPSLYVICTDNDAGDTMNVTWWSNSSGNWIQFGYNNSVANNTNITQDNSNFSAYSTTYYWSVNCSDGYGWNNETYHFTTESSPTVEPPTNWDIPVLPYANHMSHNTINMTWTKGLNATHTRIQRKTGGFPTSISDGTNVYNGTGESHSDTGLTPGTSNYRYRAWSYNSTLINFSTGYAQMTDPSITTPLEPTNFVATTINNTIINITWTKGTGSELTHVRYKTGSYPSNIGDGNQAYLGGLDYKNLTGLDPTTQYFFRAWAGDDVSEYYSFWYANATNTTDGSGAITYSNFTLSHSQRHTTTVTTSPSDYINFSITATNATAIQINITDAFSVIHTESILANKSGNNYWCNRTIPPSWGNGTYSIKIYANSSTVNNESSSSSFTMYPVCDVNKNNWTTATDITQIIGSNWGSNGAYRFCVEDVNGNGWVTATDITYVIDPNRWGAVTKP